MLLAPVVLMARRMEAVDDIVSPADTPIGAPTDICQRARQRTFASDTRRRVSRCRSPALLPTSQPGRNISGPSLPPQANSATCTTEPSGVEAKGQPGRARGTAPCRLQLLVCNTRYGCQIFHLRRRHASLVADACTLLFPTLHECSGGNTPSEDPTPLILVFLCETPVHQAHLVWLVGVSTGSCSRESLCASIISKSWCSGAAAAVRHARHFCDRVGLRARRTTICCC